MKNKFMVNTTTVKELFTLHTFLECDQKVKLKIVQDAFFDKKPYCEKSKNYSLAKNNGDLPLYIIKDSSLAAEASRFVVSEKNREIRIYASCKRGAIYTLDFILGSIKRIGKKCYIPVMEGSDHPSFPIRGVIEGFYGLPWASEVREDVVKSIRKYKMNSYFYAPKNDPYHRDNWRELYEGIFLEELMQILDNCKKNYIDFYFSISPGLDFDPSKQDDFDQLFNKLSQMIDLGVTKFSILLDDIDNKLSDQNQLRFGNPGVAHAYIVNKVNKFLSTKLACYHLSMCPTEYYDTFQTDYKKTLADSLDKNVLVFWTGYHTIAEVIDEKDGKKVNNIYNHEMLLWDNYPVNDFIFDRIFMAPIENRSTKLPVYHKGMFSNPMGLWHTGKIAVSSMGDYMWNPERYHPLLSLDKAISQIIEESLVEDLKTVVIANYWSVPSSRFSLEFKEILAKGKREVYNYYTKLYKSANRLRKSRKNTELIEEMEMWLDRIDEEYSLIKKLYEGEEIREDDIVETLNSTIQIGTTLLRDFVLKFGYLSQSAFEKKVLSSEENYYKRITMRPKYWEI